ncbi:MAG: alpha/beta hydrolase [Saprospiraceae bacterium]
MQAHKLQVQRTAHYFTLGTPGDHIENVWFVIHGYGQLAKTFIHNFSDLDDGKTLVVAPTGLNYFYWDRFTGNPVATWMTKENRLDEIADYCNYLQQLFNLYISQLPDNVTINILGFSQGVQTTMRFLHAKQPYFHRLILWAGILPDDLDLTPQRDYFAAKDIHFIYGTEDEFIKEKYVKMQLELVEKNELEVEVHTFEGKHKVKREALLELNGKF